MIVSKNSNGLVFRKSRVKLRSISSSAKLGRGILDEKMEVSRIRREEQGSSISILLKRLIVYSNRNAESTNGRERRRRIRVLCR